MITASSDHNGLEPREKEPSSFEIAYREAETRRILRELESEEEV